jgi:hypothetical protein
MFGLSITQLAAVAIGVIVGASLMVTVGAVVGVVAVAVIGGGYIYLSDDDRASAPAIATTPPDNATPASDSGVTSHVSPTYGCVSDLIAFTVPRLCATRRDGGVSVA